MGSISEGSSGEGSGVLVTSPRNELVTASGVSRDQRDEIAERWLREKGTGSAHTADRYRRDIGSFFRWADEHGHDVFAMLPWHVGAYMADLKDGWAGELRASTRAGRLAAVSSFYRFVQQNVPGSFLPNPAQHVARPKFDSSETTTRGLDATELAALRAAALASSPRDYALVQLLVGAGLRISEALEADARHLVRETGQHYLYVKRKGKEDRVPVQVPDTAVRALHRYLRGRKGPLFLDRRGARLSRRAALDRIGRLAVKAGLTGRSISPHSLRHTATTLALSAGVPIRDVQVQMGHASTETTARYDRANRRRDNPTVAALDRIIADDLPDVT
jgi:site-specific recombinase XerD